MGCIYKLTNTKNNKIYIGKTTGSVSTRWREHVSAAISDRAKNDYNFLLHKAIRKYGEEAFTVETIETMETPEELILREQYWINYYNSCILEEDSNGYNMTYGGEGSSSINWGKVFQLWDEGLGSLKIAADMGHRPISIRRILSSKSNYSSELDFARNSGVPVYCYNENGVLLCSYPSITYAAKQVGIDPSIINKCCNKIKKSGAGYFWSYSDKEVFEKTSLKRWRTLPIKQYTLEGEFIAEYPSLAAAARAMGKKNTKQIKECCEKVRKDMYGYIWKYKNEYVDTMAQTASLTAKEIL